MMMPKKRKRILIITLIILLVLMIIGIIVALYLKTDIFKSNEELFQKYISQGIENTGNLSNKIAKSDYEQLIEQSPYMSETNINISCTENINTELENANPINKLELQLEGVTDKANDYNYQDIKLLNDDNEIAKMKYLQDGNVYGIHFSDIFNQYILADGDDVPTILESTGMSKEQTEQISEKLNFNIDFRKCF